MSDRETRKLLYVEDDPQARELLERLLRVKYPQIVLYTASNGEEGLRLFKEHRPQLIVTDINMPQSNGIEMAREIRKEAPEVFLIAVTAYHDGEFAAQAAEVGFNGYITKPVEYKKLLEAINEALTAARS